MPWRGANYEGEFPSLGWALLELVEEYLKVPAGLRYGEPLVFTDEQVRFVVRLYAVDPKSGRRLKRRGYMRRPKGWGKSPMVAGLCFAELVGPVVFDGWDAAGEPIGRPHPTPEIQIAALAEDQTSNTYEPLFRMLSESPAIDEFGIDLGKTRIYLKGRPGKVEPVTSAAGTREGEPTTFAVLEETHLWTPSNHGRKVADVLRRNAAKTGGTSVEVTNAWVKGEESVAEATEAAAEKDPKGILVDVLEGPDVDDLGDPDELIPALRVAYGDATWIDLDRIFEDANDPDTTEADAKRFYLNRIVKADTQAIDMLRWDELAGAGGPPEDGARIGLGFDGSISDDSTALIGTTAEQYQFVLRIWSRPIDAPDEWRVPRLEVHEAVAAAFDRFDVGRMLCDPAKWDTEIEGWQRLYGDEVVLFFDTNKYVRMAAACRRWATAVELEQLSHDGNEELGRHVANMARKKVRLRDPDPDDDGRTQYVFVKRGTGKIDAGIGAVLSLEAAMTMPEKAEAVPLGAWR